MFDGFSAEILARVQFAFTVSFHIIFPAFSIGLASFLAVLNSMNKFSGKMKDATLDDISPLFFDFSFVHKSLARQ